MFETILIPYDGSQSSMQALDSAIATAKRTGATVHVVYVVDLDDIPGSHDELLADHGDELTVEGTGQDILSDAVERVAAADVVVEDSLLRGDTATALLEHVDTIDGDLIVLGHHETRRLHHFLHRSVAEQVVRASTVPVLTVPESSDNADSAWQSILLATDGRSGSQRATDIAFEFAETYGVTVRGVYVLASRFARSTPFREVLEHEARKTERELGTRAARSGIDFVWEQREGKPAKEILAAVDDYRADLVVMGTRGQTGLDRLFMGSVARTVLRTSSIPVLTIRTT